MRPSPKTSILAPTRCGVEPVVETMVTSAAGSPALERLGDGGEDFLVHLALYAIMDQSRGDRRPAAPPSRQAPASEADGRSQSWVRLGAGQERLRDGARAAGAGELAGVGVDVDEGEPSGGARTATLGLPGERPAS